MHVFSGIYVRVCTLARVHIHVYVCVCVCVRVRVRVCVETCIFLCVCGAMSSPSTSNHHVLSYNAASRICICSLSTGLMQLSPIRITCCYSKTLAESYDRCSSCSRRTCWRDHITPAMRDLHWLPIVYRIKDKLCTLMPATANNIPEYITEIFVRNTSLQQRAALRSFISGGYVVPRSKTEFGKRAFCVAGHKA